MEDELVVIPDFSNYKINRKGEVFDIKNDRFIYPHKNNGYWNYVIRDNNGVKRTQSRHRLLCHVFQNLDLNNKGLVVNHINGVRGDDRLENLECVTPLENIEHAGRIGISSKCLPVKVFDHINKKEYYFPSIKKASSFMGISHDSGKHQVRCTNKNIINGFEIKLAKDDTPWTEPLEFIDLENLDNQIGQEVVINIVLTGEIKHFNKLQDAADYLEVVPSVITQLSKKDKNYIHIVKDKIIRLQLLSNYSPWDPVEDLYLELAKQGKAIPFVCNDHEKKVFLTCIICAKYMGISPTLLDYRLKTNFRTVFSDGFRYGYYIDFCKFGSV